MKKRGRLNVMPDDLEHAVGIRVQTLRDFNERVERVSDFAISRLAEAGLLKTAAQQALGEKCSTGSRHPSQEEVDAFVNNIRFFIQNNEATSFQNLAESYHELPLPDELKREFNDCWARLNHWLDSKSSLGMNGAPLTHRVVFDTFIYGNVAHQNAAKRQLFDEWRQSALSFPFFETLFVDTMGKFNHFLTEAAALNKIALGHLTRRTKISCIQETTS